MYSLNIDGEVRDYRFSNKKSSYAYNFYNFYLGDEFVGQIFHYGKNNWVSITWKNLNNDPLLGPRKVVGFGTRLDAANYMLRIRNLIKE